jgi:hypothetical protein
VTSIDPIYKLTSAGWAVINRSHDIAVAALIVALLRIAWAL